MNCRIYKDLTGLEARKWHASPVLFHSPPYLQLHLRGGRLRSFTLEDGNEVVASIHFENSGDGWVSQPRAPFGGGSGTGQVTDRDWEVLLLLAVNELNEEPLVLQLPFEGYPGVMPGGLNKVLRAGFELLYTDAQQYMLLDSGMMLRMHKSQLRRLQKCQTAGFLFREEPTQNLKEIHAFITECRKVQQLQVNISLEKLQDSVLQLPGVYHFFSVRDNGKLIAACVTARVSPQVLYYYLPGALKGYSQFSPMVMLLHGIAEWALARGFQLLDLGRSSFEGKLQQGLFTFKERMGAMVGESVTLVKPARNR